VDNLLDMGKSKYTLRVLPERVPKGARFVFVLAEDVQPTKTVENKLHNHRDDYDSNNPSDQSIDKTETTTKDGFENITRPSDEISILKACRCLEECR